MKYVKINQTIHCCMCQKRGRRKNESYKYVHYGKLWLLELREINVINNTEIKTQSHI